MAKSFRFPRWVEKTRTYSIHPVAFIDQPAATPHQPRYAQQLPPGGSQGGIAAPGRQVGAPYRACAILQPLPDFEAHRRGRRLGSPPFPEQMGTLNGISLRNLLLASPRGKPRRLRRSSRQVGDPYQAQKLLACSSQQDTTYSLFTLTYYFRSRRWAMPGGSGNQRVGTIPVRHCPAALPPPYVFPSGRRGLDLFFSHSQGIMHW